jgi:toxin-antitoxin system PIN domain toxin
VILVDANLLLYAYNPSFEQHATAKRWLEDMLAKPEPVCLAWPTILAFLRIITNPRAFESPLSVEEAVAVVAEWLERPNLQILQPTERHWDILQRLLNSVPVRGALIMDADLAALAIEHGAVLCSSDRDLQRFSGLQTLNPLTPAE